MTVYKAGKAAMALMVLTLATPALAQNNVTTTDIQRLQDEVYQAGADVSRLRTTDALEGGRLQDELDTVREEVIYLKVKQRKENNVSRSEYPRRAHSHPGFARAGPRRRVERTQQHHHHGIVRFGDHRGHFDRRHCRRQHFNRRHDQ